MSSRNVIAVDDASFDALVLKSDQPVLLEFNSKQCAPCRALAPIVEQVANEGVGRYRVFSIDIDDAPRVTTRYGIRAVPTLLAFHGAVPKGQLVGIQKKDAILNLVR